ncbi:M56 family metallopeptidase [Caulobacter sp. FWC2]|uniref:M56 family metallopeptidase n=1 Tax=Caulobacter sp. FWC2 TaxID=69664 RepID=UPI000C1612C0|nr:M56 family metallopeptidase [Caulobacter sp. FWC2]PIB90966.1 peptidase M56 [Caulobacter sp. FWC2]
MIDLLVLALMRVQIAAAVGVLAVLLLRLPVRWLLGPRLAYGLWMLVPTAAIAGLFPSLAETTRAGVAAEPLGPSLALKLLLAWAMGAALLAGVMMLQERAFRRRAERGQAGPAVVGALWPRLVLPADFESRFSARERDLILRHERTHIRRGDPVANLIVAGCRVAGWCNPMIHLGAAFVRIDQELACDATVLALRNDIRADYARALLKVSRFGVASPLACGWGTHPLVLRVGFLGRSEPSVRRQITGYVLLPILAIATFVGVWTMAPRGFDSLAMAPDALYVPSAEHGWKLP